MTKYAKAIIAALIAGLGSISAAIAAGHLDAQAVIAAVIATLVALGAVYSTPNAT